MELLNLITESGVSAEAHIASPFLRTGNCVALFILHLLAEHK
jgi:hypothetical protein